MSQTQGSRTSHPQPDSLARPLILGSVALALIAWAARPDESAIAAAIAGGR
jgi:hypothetical protein